MMQRTLITPPALEPLTFVEAKLHLRVEDDDQDDLITPLIVAARQYVENYTQRALITQTWRVTLDTFPEDDWDGNPGYISLPYPPVQSITSLYYSEELAGVSTLWSSTYYGLETGWLSGRLRPVYGEVWPTPRTQSGAVRVDYVAGYGDDAEDVPEAIRHAIRLLVGHWYEHREPVLTGTISSSLPFAVEALLSPYRIMEFA